jgi:hypothetical protein
LRAIATHCRSLQDLLLYYDPVFPDQFPDIDPDDEAPSISDAGIIAIAQNCQLRVLRISDHRLIMNAALMALATHCPALHTLLLCGFKATDAGLAAVARGCAELQDVSVTLVKAIINHGIIDLAEQLPKLRNLCCEENIYDAVSDLFHCQWPAVEFSTDYPGWTNDTDAFTLD